MRLSVFKKLILLLKRGCPLSDSTKGHYDVILASDCVYLEAAFDPLLSTLHSLLGPTSQALIVSKKRRKADKRFFQKLFKQFTCVEVKDDPNYEVFSKQGLSIISAAVKNNKVVQSSCSYSSCTTSSASKHTLLGVVDQNP